MTSLIGTAKHGVKQRSRARFSNNQAINRLKKTVPPSLLASVKRQKRAWFGNVTRHDILSKAILQGILEGGRRRGRRWKCPMNNTREDILAHARTAHMGLLLKKLEEKISAESSLMSPRRPNRSRNLWADPKYAVLRSLMMVAFSSLARIWGECSTTQSQPALFFLFFFGGGGGSGD